MTDNLRLLSVYLHDFSSVHLDRKFSIGYGLKNDLVSIFDILWYLTSYPKIF